MSSPRSIVFRINLCLLCALVTITLNDCSEPPPNNSNTPPVEATQSESTESGNLSEPHLPEKPEKKDIIIERAMQPFKGDLPKIRKRRIIRALVSYSKSNYFLDKGVARGFEYELLRDYESHLNRSVKQVYDQIKIYFIPVPFDQLLSALVEGRGDIAAAGLTITPERAKAVSFTHPYIPAVSEVVVRNKAVSDLKTIADLAGREVYVRSKSSYVTHLSRLNRAFKTEHRTPIKVVEADSILGTEDILEMVNAGVVKVTVADHHIADAWSQVLPNIRIEKEIKINSGGRIAWAVRKNNPELLHSLNDFMKSRKKGSLLGNILFKRYYQQSKWIKNPLDEKERKKLAMLVSLFKKYSDQYGFDWLAIAAQAYQESELNHRKKSPAGAIGIMQLLPSTASGDPINITQIEKLENNIHAGVKYLDFLRERYFTDSAISPEAQVDFAWAAYNAGPARINRLRSIAAERGLDPNKWFHHVERIAAEKIGRETVSYVANINKYYIAYKLYRDKTLAREVALKSFESTGTNAVPRSKAGRGQDAGLKMAAMFESKTTSDPKKMMNGTLATTKIKFSMKKKTKNPRLRFHTVQTGDSLYSISRKYGLSVQQLKTMNYLNVSGLIHPGDRLIVSNP